MNRDLQHPGVSIRTNVPFDVVNADDPWALSSEEQRDAIAIGKTLRRFRRLRRAGEPRISQRSLAEASGLSAGGVGKIERGQGRVRASSLRKLSRGLVALRPRLGSAPELLVALLDAGPHAIAAEKRAGRGTRVPA